MKTKLFSETELNEQAIRDTLELENCGVEERHDFIRAFTEDEMATAEAEYLDFAKQLSILDQKLKDLSDPIRSEMKPIKTALAGLIEMLKCGGKRVTEKVYCFPDQESRMMGLYDSTGTLVGTRPMSQSERQLHINSFNKRAVNE